MRRQDWNRRLPALSAEADDSRADRTIVNAGVRGHGRTALLADCRAPRTPMQTNACTYARLVLERRPSGPPPRRSAFASVTGRTCATR
jgi:hypothetical protein